MWKLQLVSSNLNALLDNVIKQTMLTCHQNLKYLFMFIEVEFENRGNVKLMEWNCYLHHYEEFIPNTL